MKLTILTRLMLIVGAAVILPSVAWAVASQSISPAAQAQKLTNLKTKGIAEIDRRLANLSAAQAKLSKATKLTTVDKTNLTDQIRNELEGLDSFKQKLTVDTDLAAARTHVASIVTDYRVYVLILPKARLATALDRLDVVQDKLIHLEATLQAKIRTAQTTGRDVTAMTASLTNMQTKTAGVAANTSGLAAQILALQPGDYNANHAALLAYRQTLGTAQADVKAARDDAKSIIETLTASQ